MVSPLPVTVEPLDKTADHIQALGKITVGPSGQITATGGNVTSNVETQIVIQGVGWVGQQTPLVNNLNGVFFYDHRRGWAVGDAGIAHTVDGGDNWDALPTEPIRGLRAVSDFDYEFQLALMNRKLERDVESVFLMPGFRWIYISSSIIKDAARHGGNVQELVPDHVSQLLIEKFSRAEES